MTLAHLSLVFIAPTHRGIVAHLQGWPGKMKATYIFTARCTTVQSAVLRSHVVCLSVCDVAGLWSHKKIISRLVSVGRSLSADPNIMDLLQGKQQEIWAQIDPPVDFSVGDIRSQIAAEWLHIVQRSQWRAYRKPPSLFLMVPSLTPYDLPFPPKWGFHMPPTYTNLCNGRSDPLHVWF